MFSLRSVMARLRGLVRAERVYHEISEEMQFHIDMATEENIRRGLSPAEARRDAERRFGNLTRMKERGYEVRGGRWLEALAKDIVFSLRMLRKDRALTTAAVLSLALGIGVNSAIFSLMNAVLFSKLPVAAPEQLTRFFTLREGGNTNHNFSYPEYRDYRDHNRNFAGVIAHSPVTVSVGTSYENERVKGEMVSGNYFPVLGVNGVQGELSMVDAEQRGESVAVISHSLWQRRFGGGAQLAGTSALINGQPYTIIGIAPRGFTGTVMGEVTDVWLPVVLQPKLMPSEKSFLDRPTTRWLYIMGRLKEGVSRTAAEAELRSFNYDKPNGVPGLADGSRGYSFYLTGLEPQVKILMAVVIFVLLIACTNIANLLLARALARRREVAVRLALGASRSRLIRQLLTESLVLALLGGIVGIAVAYWTINLLALMLPTFGPDPMGINLAIDLRVIAFTIAISIASGLLFGIVPAIQATRLDLVNALKDENSMVGIRTGRFALRNILVAAQVTVSLLLLVCAGLLVRTLLNLRAIDPGFNTDNVLIMNLDLDLNGYPAPAGRAFYEEVAERLQAVEGVQSVSYTQTVPLSPYGMRMTLPIPGSEDGLDVDAYIVGGGFFQTMEIPIMRGRDFSPADIEGRPRVILVNETMAGRFWPAGDAIGQEIKLGKSSLTVIGIVKDSKYRGLREAATPVMYMSLAQTYRPAMSLLIRTRTDAINYFERARAIIREIDALVPVFNVKTLTEHASNTYARESMTAWLCAAFGLLALMLAAIGIYGVTSYSVSQRTKEIGVRIALGARYLDLIKMIIVKSMTLVIIGILFGIGAALALSKLLAGLLYEVKPTDPVTYIVVSLILVGVAALACYLPARRAAKVDPMVALRYE